MRKLIISGAFGALVIAGAFLAPGAKAAVPGCTDTAVAKVCAQGSPTAQTGEVYVQGHSAVPRIGNGYIGVNSTEGLVGCSNGTYNGTSDNVISPIPPTGAPGAPNPANPCNP